MGFLGSSLNLFIQSCEITNRQLDCKFLSDYYTDSYRFPWHVLRDNSPSESGMITISCENVFPFPV